MHLLAFNLLRALIQEAPRYSEVPLEQMGFTGKKDSSQQEGVSHFPGNSHLRAPTTAIMRL